MQPQPALKQVLKGLVGLALGLGLWLGFSSLYRSTVLAPAEMLLNVTESPDVTELLPDDEKGVIVNRADFPPESPRPGIPLPDLTFNVILLVALFAISRKAISNANVSGLGISLIVLWLTHVLALVVRIKRIYALQLGEWSVANYGALSRNLWGSLDHFYRVVGMYAIAFALWWLLRGENWKSRGSRSRRKGKR